MVKTVITPVTAAILAAILDFSESSRVIPPHPLDSYSGPSYISKNAIKWFPQNFEGYLGLATGLYQLIAKPGNKTGQAHLHDLDPSDMHLLMAVKCMILAVYKYTIFSSICSILCYQLSLCISNLSCGWFSGISNVWFYFNLGINSSAPGRPRCHFESAIFNLALLIGIFTPSKDNALRWMPWDLTDDKSTLVQVMAWCHQATSHYLSQCWPSYMSPYGVTRPQWVKDTKVYSELTYWICLMISYKTKKNKCWVLVKQTWRIWVKYHMNFLWIAIETKQNNVRQNWVYMWIMLYVHVYIYIYILGREIGPGGVSPYQRSRWKHAFSPLKHV